MCYVSTTMLIRLLSDFPVDSPVVQAEILRVLQAHLSAVAKGEHDHADLFNDVHVIDRDAWLEGEKKGLTLAECRAKFLGRPGPPSEGEAPPKDEKEANAREMREYARILCEIMRQRRCF